MANSTPKGGDNNGIYPSLPYIFGDLRSQGFMGDKLHAVLLF